MNTVRSPWFSVSHEISGASCSFRTHLVAEHRMRADRLLVEAAHLDVEALLDPLAQRPGGIARGGIEVDVGVPVLDLGCLILRVHAPHPITLHNPPVGTWSRSPDRAGLLGLAHHELRFLRRPEAAQGAGSQVPRRQVPDQGRAPRAGRQRRPMPRRSGRASSSSACRASASRKRIGGLGLSPLELCVVAEEIGRAAAPVPFDTSVVLATEALKLAGSEAQKKKWLPLLAERQGDRHAWPSPRARSRPGRATSARPSAAAASTARRCRWPTATPRPSRSCWPTRRHGDRASRWCWSISSNRR